MLPNFPDFLNLTIEDKALFERVAKKYPPISDLSFTTLMIWWNGTGRGIPVSTLNGNLIVHYQGSQSDSGVSLIGDNKIDESMDSIFQVLRQRNLPQQLVHVPEFVIDLIHHKTDYKIHEERGYREYLVPVAGLYPLGQTWHNRRRKIRRFLEQVGCLNRRIDMQPLDLSVAANRTLLIKKATHWGSRHTVNDVERAELKAISSSTLAFPDKIGIECLCLFIDNELQGFQLYQYSHDRDYIILNHLKVSHDYKYMVPYMEYEMARLASMNGVKFLNFEMDLNIMGLRICKSELRPSGYFKKYSIEPLC